ncbi:MAG: laccase domain-containing protein, partial [Syntrophaceae bacterium]
MHGFCTRVGGVSDGPYATPNVSPREGDPPERVRMNWQRLASAFE